MDLTLHLANHQYIYNKNCEYCDLKDTFESLVEYRDGQIRPLKDNQDLIFSANNRPSVAEHIKIEDLL